MEPVPLVPLRTRRGWGQRALLAVIGLVAAGALLASAAVAVAVRDLSDVERLDLAADLTRAPETPVAASRIATDDATADSVPPPGPAENYLIVGSDSAANVSSDSPILSDREENEGVYLADTIMVVRVRPSDGTAYLLSIPRDLRVQIAGIGGQAKVNSAYNLPEQDQRARRLIDTIEQNLDVPIQHFIEIDLAAFSRLIDAVGGVDVCFEHPTRNPRTGLDIPEAGIHHLDGTTALQFVRSRAEYQELIDGVWQDVGTQSDFDRIERQQEFLGAAVDQAFSQVVSDPRQLNRVLGIVTETVTISNTLDVFANGPELASWFGDFGSEDLVTEQLAVTDLGDGTTDLGMLPAAEVQLDRLRGIEPGDVVPGRVDVTVAGPEPVARQAVVIGLSGLGFEAEGESAEPSQGTGVAIRYGAEGAQAALLVAAYLDAAVEWVPDAELGPNQVVVELSEETPTVLATARRVPTSPPPVPAAPGEAATTTTPTTDEPSMCE
jgi:polyisoprenyl-teichoic acid--peptidoglycan teichoic acid transferase